jgi:hypothetical protein
MIACSNPGQQQPSTAGPSPVTAEDAADGSTLKVTAPTLVSPVGGIQLTVLKPTFVWTVATGKYAASTFSYRAQVLSASGALIKETVTTGLQWAVTDDPEVSTVYQWRVRAEVGTYIGPWSTTASFKSMDKPTSFLRNNELYDALDDGKTIGRISGPAHFIPGVGIKLDSEQTYVEYTLPQTLVAGEYSALITNVKSISSTEDPKWRALTMRQGWAAMNDNPYRMSVEKRGNAVVAWRFITGNINDFVDTIGAERVVISMNENMTYFYKATWTGGVFNVTIKAGGFNGATIYNFGKPYKGTYAPSPHNVYIGSPWAPGDRGEHCSVKDMIIRQVWVSPNPRPSYINQ